MTVRAAEPGDVEALRDIAAAAYQHYVPRIGHPPAPMTADYAQAIRSRQAWVAVDGGEVTGFVILIAQPGYLLLDNIAVRPDAQGRGTGARLLDLAEDHARRLHLGEVRLYTNEDRGPPHPPSPPQPAAAGGRAGHHRGPRPRRPLPHVRPPALPG